MKIAHIGIWTQDIESMREFYLTYFGGVSAEKYVNSKTSFESYFIRFDNDTTLELMYRPDIDRPHSQSNNLGIAHIAFELGSEEAVLSLTNRLREAGYTIAGEPRTTGDGYFESLILDIEGNKIELLAINTL